MKILILSSLVMMNSAMKAQNQYPPKDESATDASLAACVNELKLAIKAKDAPKLYKLIDPNITNGFGGDDGLANFKTMWKPQEKNSDLWIILNKIVSLGGVFLPSQQRGKKEFVFPYVFAADIKEGNDPFSMLVVTGKNVNVREQPDLKAKVVAQVSYIAVDINYEKSVPPENPTWYFVSTPNKKISGYMFHEFLYSPLGYRMFLTKGKGKWLITSLVAGD